MLTRDHLRETELRLQKEIEQVLAETVQRRGEFRETELRLQKEIEQVRGQIVRSKVGLLKWLIPLMIARVAAIAALVKLL